MDVHSGTIGFDDFQVDQMATGRDITARIGQSGEVTLTVQDNALQEDSTSITVNSIMADPPVAVINGPTTGDVGVDLFFDGFVTKIDPSQVGNLSLVYSTYLGGSGDDQAKGIAVDAAGNAYVTGITFSTDFPSTLGAFDTSCGTDGACDGSRYNGNSSPALTPMHAALRRAPHV